MASRKVDFALAVRKAVTALAEATERITELDEIFTDSGYDSGGSDPIVDEGDQASETREGWLKVYVTDDGNQITDQVYQLRRKTTPFQWQWI